MSWSSNSAPTVYLGVTCSNLTPEIGYYD